MCAAEYVCYESLYAIKVIIYSGWSLCLKQCVISPKPLNFSVPGELVIAMKPNTLWKGTKLPAAENGELKKVKTKKEPPQPLLDKKNDLDSTAINELLEGELVTLVLWISFIQVFDFFLLYSILQHF